MTTSTKLISNFTKENFRKFNILNGEWYEGQELQTNEIARFFSLKEVDIPCLHLTFLIPGFEYVIKLKKSNEIYSVVKKIIETLDKGHYENIKTKTKDLIKKKQNLQRKLDRILKTKHFSSHKNLEELSQDDRLDNVIKNTITQILEFNPSSFSVEKLEKNIRFLKKNSNFENYYPDYKNDIKIIYDVLTDKCTSVNVDEYYEKLDKTTEALKLIDIHINNELTQSKEYLIKLLNKELQQYQRPNIKYEGIIQKVISTLELKPNVFGIGVNLNQMIESLFFKR